MKPIKVGDLVVIESFEYQRRFCIVIEQHRKYPQLFNLYEFNTGKKIHLIHRAVLKLVQKNKKEYVEP